VDLGSPAAEIFDLRLDETIITATVGDWERHGGPHSRPAEA